MPSFPSIRSTILPIGADALTGPGLDGGNIAEDGISLGWADRIADPPKTGDGTAFYALTALIALLPLAVVSICAAKKRRRAI